MTDFKLEKRQSRLGALYNDVEDWFIAVVIDDIGMHTTRMMYGLGAFAAIALAVGFVMWILIKSPLWAIGGALLLAFVYLVGYLIEDW